MSSKILLRGATSTALSICLSLGASSLYAQGIITDEMQMDGNTDPTTSKAPFLGAPDDWDDVCDEVGQCTGGGSTNALDSGFSPDSGATGFNTGNAIQSGPDVTMFAGGDKDDDPMSDWGCVASNNPQVKTNLIYNSGAIYQAGNGDLVIFASSQLEQQQGTSTFGFWFFQDPAVACDSAGTGVFTGKKTVGDVLMVADVSGSGPVLNGYRWIDPNGIPDDGDECVGNSSTNTCGVPELTGFNCDDMANFNPATDSLCGIFNPAPVTSHWGTIPANSFVEIALNFTDVIGPDLCFSKFMAMGRASTSLDAQIKDFEIGNFNTCGSLEVVKEANEPDTFSFTVSPDPDDPNNPSTNFILDLTVEDTSKLFPFVLSGDYTIDETLPSAEWSIVDIECIHQNDPENPISGDTSTGEVDITIGVADNVVCTYTNTKPGITINKLTNGQDGATITFGSPVTWTYEVTNTSEVELTNVTVTDDQGVAVNCPSNTLAPLASMNCTANGVAELGPYSNLGTVTADFNGVMLAESDPSSYIGVLGGVELEKSTNGQDADTPTGPLIPVGNAVAWTYEVSNTGDVELSEIAVTDDQGVTVTCPSTTLIPGNSMTCTANGTAVAGQYSNLGIVLARDAQGAQRGDSDPSNYFGVDASITIEKTTNGADADSPPGPSVFAGTTIEWSYVVTNTGNVALDPVTVTDDKVSVSCPDTKLAIGATMTCTASGIAQLGQYENTGMATGTPPDGPNATDTDKSHYFGVEIPPPPIVPVSTKPIPTLSEWAMILLSGLLAIAAVPAFRRR